MLDTAYLLIAQSCINSSIPSTRKYWRERYGIEDMETDYVLSNPETKITTEESKDEAKN